MNRQHGAARPLHDSLGRAPEKGGIERTMTGGAENHQLGSQPLSFSHDDLGRLTDSDLPGGGDSKVPRFLSDSIEVLSGSVLQLHRDPGLELAVVRRPPGQVQGVDQVESKALLGGDLNGPTNPGIRGLGEIGSGDDRPRVGR